MGIGRWIGAGVTVRSAPGSSPQSAAQLADALGEHPVPMLEVTAERLVFGLAVANAEAGLHPPAADHVDDGHLLGELDRGVQREQGDRGADAQA